MLDKEIATRVVESVYVMGTTWPITRRLLRSEAGWFVVTTCNDMRENSEEFFPSEPRARAVFDGRYKDCANKRKCGELVPDCGGNGLCGGCDEAAYDSNVAEGRRGWNEREK